jgi:hypothetical protein
MRPSLGLVWRRRAGRAGWAIAQGWADLERAEPLCPAHRFPAYGITRLITATAVLRLIADGRDGNRRALSPASHHSTARYCHAAAPAAPPGQKPPATHPVDHDRPRTMTRLANSEDPYFVRFLHRKHARKDVNSLRSSHVAGDGHQPEHERLRDRRPRPEASPQPPGNNYVKWSDKFNPSRLLLDRLFQKPPPAGSRLPLPDGLWLPLPGGSRRPLRNRR